MSDNVRKFTEPIMVPSIVDATGAPLGGGGDAVGGDQPFVSTDADSTLASEDWAIKTDTLTLDSLVVSMTAGSRAGSAVIATNPADAYKQIVGCAMKLDLVLDENWAGSEVLQVGIGTSQNTNSSLGSNEENILASDDVGVTGSGELTQNSSDDTNGNQLTPGMIVDASDSVYLNVITNIGVTGDVTLTGTITLIYWELG